MINILISSDEADDFFKNVKHCRLTSIVIIYYEDVLGKYYNKINSSIKLVHKDVDYKEVRNIIIEEFITYFARRVNISDNDDIASYVIDLIKLSVDDHSLTTSVYIDYKILEDLLGKMLIDLDYYIHSIVNKYYGLEVIYDEVISVYKKIGIIYSNSNSSLKIMNLELENEKIS